MGIPETAFSVPPKAGKSPKSDFSHGLLAFDGGEPTVNIPSCERLLSGQEPCLEGQRRLQERPYDSTLE